jgi:glycosyltransferase involved in cell wall biosynthesis
MANRTVLWWGRFDPNYSRNRVLRKLLRELGWTIRDFRPLLSRFAGAEAGLRLTAKPDLVWVPCFRQRDAAAATAWARARAVPILFDPLISAWDKQVFERQKFAENSTEAQQFLAWEQGLFRHMDMIVADTGPHAEFFAERFGLAMERLAVIPVGAEEPLFAPAPPDRAHQGPVEVLFFGSFIGLQGPAVIIEAAKQYDGPPVSWHLLGAGPLLADCRAAAEGLDNVAFEPWIDYKRLPQRKSRAGNPQQGLPGAGLWAPGDYAALRGLSARPGRACQRYRLRTAGRRECAGESGIGMGVTARPPARSLGQCNRQLWLPFQQCRDSRATTRYPREAWI